MNFINNLVSALMSLISDIFGIINVFKNKKQEDNKKQDVIETKKEEIDVKTEVVTSNIDSLNQDLGWKS